MTRKKAKTVLSNTSAVRAAQQVLSTRPEDPTVLASLIAAIKGPGTAFKAGNYTPAAAIKHLQSCRGSGYNQLVGNIGAAVAAFVSLTADYPVAAFPTSALDLAVGSASVESKGSVYDGVVQFNLRKKQMHTADFFALTVLADHSALPLGHMTLFVPSHDILGLWQESAQSGSDQFNLAGNPFGGKSVVAQLVEKYSHVPLSELIGQSTSQLSIW